MTPLLRSPPPGPRRGPEHYWRTIKRFGARGFTIPELHHRTADVSYTTVKLYVHLLRDLGAVEVIGSEQTAAKGARALRYVVVKALPSAPVRRNVAAFKDIQGRRQWQLWTAMRALPSFFVRELAVTASTDEVEVKLGIATAYVSALLAAGLLQVITPAGVPKGAWRRGAVPGVYRLTPSANTGPRALKIIGNRVFDPNTRDFVGLAIDGSEVSA